jgi:ABC-type glutathione transport system ATPase component
VSLLEVKDLNIDFGRRRVVHGASFTLDGGEKLALVGESARPSPRSPRCG